MQLSQNQQNQQQGSHIKDDMQQIYEMTQELVEISKNMYKTQDEQEFRDMYRYQLQLSDELKQMLKQKGQMFNNALTVLEKYWDNLTMLRIIEIKQEVEKVYQRYQQSNSQQQQNDTEDKIVKQFILTHPQSGQKLVMNDGKAVPITSKKVVNQYIKNKYSIINKIDDYHAMKSQDQQKELQNQMVQDIKANPQQQSYKQFKDSCRTIRKQQQEQYMSQKSIQDQLNNDNYQYDVEQSYNIVCKSKQIPRVQQVQVTDYDDQQLDQTKASQQKMIQVSQIQKQQKIDDKNNSQYKQQTSEESESRLTVQNIMKNTQQQLEQQFNTQINQKQKPEQKQQNIKMVDKETQTIEIFNDQQELQQIIQQLKVELQQQQIINQQLDEEKQQQELFYQQLIEEMKQMENKQQLDQQRPQTPIKQDIEHQKNNHVEQQIQQFEQQIQEQQQNKQEQHHKNHQQEEQKHEKINQQQERRKSQISQHDKQSKQEKLSNSSRRQSNARYDIRNFINKSQTQKQEKQQQNIENTEKQYHKPQCTQAQKYIEKQTIKQQKQQKPKQEEQQITTQSIDTQDSSKNNQIKRQSSEYLKEEVKQRNRLIDRYYFNHIIKEIPQNEQSQSKIYDEQNENRQFVDNFSKLIKNHHEDELQRRKEEKTIQRQQSFKQTPQQPTQIQQQPQKQIIDEKQKQENEMLIQEKSEEVYLKKQQWKDKIIQQVKQTEKEQEESQDKNEQN